MRTLLRVTMDINAGNEAIKTGSLPSVIKETIDRIKPEVSYFYSENGNRTGLFVFDLADVSEIPSIAEPLFVTFNAKVEFSPVMNAEEMQRGLKKAVKSQLETV
jgi:hypothetical protein